MKYIVLDNAAIPQSHKIQLLAALSGSELVSLPPYSPNLNVIEELWSACTARVKRSHLSKKEQHSPQVLEATNQIGVESFKGFCRNADTHSTNFKQGIILTSSLPLCKIFRI